MNHPARKPVATRQIGRRIVPAHEHAPPRRRASNPPAVYFIPENQRPQACAGITPRTWLATVCTSLGLWAVIAWWLA